MSHWLKVRSPRQLYKVIYCVLEASHMTHGHIAVCPAALFYLFHIRSCAANACGAASSGCFSAGLSGPLKVTFELLASAFCSILKFVRESLLGCLRSPFASRSQQWLRTGSRLAFLIFLSTQADARLGADSATPAESTSADYHAGTSADHKHWVYIGTWPHCGTMKP